MLIYLLSHLFIYIFWQFQSSILFKGSVMYTPAKEVSFCYGQPNVLLSFVIIASGRLEGWKLEIST